MAKIDKRGPKEAELKESMRLATERAKHGDYMGGSVYTAQALKLASSLGDKAVVAQLKPQLIEFNNKAQYQESEVSIPLPLEEIAKMISSYVEEEDGRVSLFRIARSNAFLINSADNEASAKANMPLTTAIVTEHVIDSDGNIVSIGDAETHWVWSMYEPQQILQIRILTSIFGRLIDEKRIDVDLVYSMFDSNPVFTPDELAKIKVGVERYFAQDYISAMHVLAPTFEGVFVRLSGEFGVDVIALGRGDATTGRKVMSEALLNSQECHDVWGRDFSDQIVFVMLSIYGFKLRHRVAHGQITPAECSLGSTTLVLAMLMRVATSIITNDPYMSIRQLLMQRKAEQAAAKAGPSATTSGALAPDSAQ